MVVWGLNHLRSLLSVEFVAGEVVNALMGFTNVGDNGFTVTTIEGSFRCVFGRVEIRIKSSLFHCCLHLSTDTLRISTITSRMYVCVCAYICVCVCVLSPDDYNVGLMRVEVK